MHSHSRLPALLALSMVTGLSVTTAHAQAVPPQVHIREASESRSRNTTGWVIAGVGGACLLGSSIVLAARQQRLEDMRAETGADITREVRPYNTAATTLLAAGVVGLGVGLPLALIGPNETRVAMSLDRVVFSGTF